MKKLILLPLLLLMAACTPVESEVMTCELEYTDGSSHITNNIYRIETLGEMTYVKYAEIRSEYHFEIVEYVIAEVRSYECWK